MKLLIVTTSVIYFAITNAYAQPGAAGVPMPDFMKKVLICKTDPDNDICQVKKTNISGGAPSQEIPIGKFNLKGLSLTLKKQDVGALLPKATFRTTGNYDGKDAVSYVCGKHIRDSTTNCDFTFGGIEILDVVIDFWGDEVTEITLYFNDYSLGIKAARGADTYQVLQDMQDGLDVKYKENANGEPRLGSRRPGDGVWTNSSEVLKFERANKLDSLVLRNTILVRQFKKSVEASNQKNEENKNQQRIKKSTSDM